jgi:hypothetical protein
VLLKVYAKCIDGQEEAARRRIESALGLDDSTEEGTAEQPNEQPPAH